MKHFLSLIFILTITSILLSRINAQIEDKNGIVVKGAELKLLSSEFSFTEGPAVDREGNVFFTDQPNDRILKWSAEDGQISVFMEGTGRSNGLYFDHDGNLLACADEKNQLWKIDMDKKASVLIKDFEGKRLNGPNDLWEDPRGGIYFTDPFYKRDYWQHEEKEIEQERVYYRSREGILKIVADDLVQPNGIIGTADGKKLFVADIRDSKTYSYQINPDGSLSNRALFCEMGSDGMTIDNKGNVYLTGRGVTVLDKMGIEVAHIPIEGKWTANVTFGGKKQKTLFITASDAVYTLDMKVKGSRKF